MKKRVCLTIVFCISIIAWLIMTYSQKRVTWLCMDEEGIYILLKADNRNEIIRPWQEKENTPYYFFLPAFANDGELFADASIEGGSINNLSIKRRSSLKWKEGKEYSIEKNNNIVNVKFMKSENIPAFFVSIEDIDYIHRDKDNETTGNLTAINEEGHLFCTSMLEKISIRGQSTAGCFKKSYSFTLQNKKALCGLDEGKKWNLLSLYYEYDKIHSKIAFDIANELGIRYAPECTWVDLYCNCHYMGLYLLIEAIDVGEGRVEIHDLEKDNKGLNLELFVEDNKINKTKEGYSLIEPKNNTGGYLIEKTPASRLQEDEDVYFKTSSEYYFVIKSPKHASIEQVEYISGFIQNIEDLIVKGNQEYKNYINIESFAKQFLLDKIVMENDAMWASTFFYKDMDSNVLYSGPPWDYDRSVGTILTNYEAGIGDAPNNMPIWYMALYEDDEFYACLIKNYHDILPYMEKVLSQGIDDYVNWISASMRMDTVLMQAYLMPDETYSYTQYDSYIRYLNFFWRTD